jgi:hypothetical protein
MPILDAKKHSNQSTQHLFHATIPAAYPPCKSQDSKHEKKQQPRRSKKSIEALEAMEAKSNTTTMKRTRKSCTYVGVVIGARARFPPTIHSLASENEKATHVASVYQDALGQTLAQDVWPSTFPYAAKSRCHT